MGNRSLRKCQMPASLVAYSSFYTQVIRFLAPLFWRDGKGNSKGRCVLFLFSPPPSEARGSPCRTGRLLAAFIGAAPTTASPYPTADLLRASSPAWAYGGRLLHLDMSSRTQPVVLFPKLLLQAGRTSLREPYYLYALNSRGLYQSRLAMHFPTPSAMSKLENTDAT